MKRFDEPASYLPLLFLAILAPAAASCQEAAESVLIDQAANTDLYLAGRNIDVLAPVEGDLVAAARRITIDNRISQDVIAAGETIFIQGDIEDDLRVAGRTVQLSGTVGGHMVAAGQVVAIASDAEVGEWAWLAGESIDITGTVRGDVMAAGRSILIDGEINGDADLLGEDIRIGPRTVISGDLTLRSAGSADISSSAQINGRLIEEGLPEDWQDDEDEDGIGSFVFSYLVLAAGSLLLFLVFPGFCRDSAGLIRREPWNCIGSGLGILIIIPILCLVFFMTLIGFLPGLAILASWFSTLIIGMLMGIIVFAAIGLQMVLKNTSDTKRAWVLSVLISTLIFSLLIAIPFIGGLIFILVWVVGIGVTALGLFRHLRDPTQQAA